MGNLITELLKASSLAFLWSGNNGWIINSKQGLVAFDLDLFNHERIEKCTLDLDTLCDNLSLHMVTHEHEDHFNTETCKLLLQKSNCKFVIPKSCLQKAIEIGICGERVVIVEPRNNYSICGMNVETIRAIHGHINGAVYSGASFYDCGYIITLDDKRIYQPGDTILLEEHCSMRDIDILMCSPTEHNTAIDNTVTLINQINPALILPQHHSTYVEADDNLFWSHGFVNEVYDQLNPKQKEQYKVLTQCEILAI